MANNGFRNAVENCPYLESYCFECNKDYLIAEKGMYHTKTIHRQIYLNYESNFCNRVDCNIYSVSQNKGSPNKKKY